LWCLLITLLVLIPVLPVAAEDTLLPKYDSQSNIISKPGFILEYNENYEQASWVAYQLTSDETYGSFNRTDNYHEDNQVNNESAELSDYRCSGYDRGHLAPAADLAWSRDAMESSFALSNMSPQKSSFNRGIWRKLELLVRAWAQEESSLYIVTGPVFRYGIVERIGDNGVGVPKYYYKAVLDYTPPERKAIGFLLPHRESDRPLSSFAVTIDRIEEITGEDFFHTLPDSSENQLESRFDTQRWNFNASVNEKGYRVESAAGADSSYTQEQDKSE